jgi:hypothetical protein
MVFPKAALGSLRSSEPDRGTKLKVSISLRKIEMRSASAVAKNVVEVEAEKVGGCAL